MPASMSASVKAMDVYWLPASEWNTIPVDVNATSPRRRVKRACSRADRTSGVVFDDETRQPRMRRLNTSVTKLT